MERDQNDRYILTGRPAAIDIEHDSIRILTGGQKVSSFCKIDRLARSVHWNAPQHGLAKFESLFGPEIRADRGVIDVTRGEHVHPNALIGKFDGEGPSHRIDSTAECRPATVPG